jgi:glycine cleavage system H protein
VVEVNTKVVEEPETINDDPYGEGWLVRVRLADPTELDSLLDPDSYRKLTAEQ